MTKLFKATQCVTTLLSQRYQLIEGCITMSPFYATIGRSRVVKYRFDVEHLTAYSAGGAAGEAAFFVDDSAFLSPAVAFFVALGLVEDSLALAFLAAGFFSSEAGFFRAGFLAVDADAPSPVAAAFFAAGFFLAAAGLAAAGLAAADFAVPAFAVVALAAAGFVAAGLAAAGLAAAGLAVAAFAAVDFAAGFAGLPD
jgi:hypothetical protein